MFQEVISIPAAAKNVKHPTSGKMAMTLKWLRFDGYFDIGWLTQKGEVSDHPCFKRPTLLVEIIPEWSDY